MAKWLSQTDAAKLVGVSVQQLSRYRAKQGWKTKTQGRKRLVRMEDVERYKASRGETEGKLSRSAFALSVGVDVRTAGRWKRLGTISEYSQAEADRMKAAHNGDATKDPAVLDSQATLADQKRSAEYWKARKAQREALEAEGLLYSHVVVERWATRVGTLITTHLEALTANMPNAIDAALADAGEPRVGDERCALLRQLLADWEERLRKGVLKELTKGRPT